MKKVTDFNLSGKTVILRCDLNVSIKDGKIIDDNKIMASLKTINYILDHNAKLVIMSHLGRVKTESDKQKYDMRIVYERLEEILHNKISFIDETKPTKLIKPVKNVSKQKLHRYEREIRFSKPYLTSKLIIS